MNVEDDAQTLYEQEYGKKNRKIWKRRKDQCKTWNMASNIEKRVKCEMHTIGPGVWQENRKSWEMRNTHCRT